MTAKITPKAAEAAPATVKPTIKKETVRIEVPTGPRVVPQATVKIQPAPAPARGPEAAVRAVVPVPVPTLKIAATEADIEESEAATHDPMVMYASWAVLLFAVVSVTLQLITYLAR